MRVVRSQHVFVALMSFAAISAFLVPPRFTDRVTPQLQVLFWPVARPVGAVAASFAARGAPDEPAVPGGEGALAMAVQNQRLIDENIKLRHEVDHLARLNGERDRMGELRPLCTPVAVVGTDAGAGQRESLAVAGSTLAGLDDGMYVLYPGTTGVHIVGRLQRSGVGGGQVQLITNPGFRFKAYFSGNRRIEAADGKPATEAFVRLHKEPVLVEGVGRQQMVVKFVKAADAKAWHLRADDYVVLEDEEWPDRLWGRRIGRVAEVVPHTGSALHVEVRITPLSDLLKLREVMVLTKDK